MKYPRCCKPTDDSWMLEPLEARRVLATVYWDGGPDGTGTNWNAAVNWVNDQRPGPDDDVVVDIPGAPAIEINATVGTAIRSLVCAEAIRMGVFGTLDITTTGTFTNSVTVFGSVTGGTWVFSGVGNAVHAGMGGILRDVTIVGDVLLDSAGTDIRIEGTTTFSNARLTAGGATLAFGDGTTLTGNIVLAGAGSHSITHSGGDCTLTIAQGAAILSGGGTLGDESLFGAGSLSIINHGLIEASASNATLRITATSLRSDGLLRVTAGGLNISHLTGPVGNVTVTTGTLTLDGDYTFVGSLDVNGGTATLGGTWSATGVVHQTGGTLNLGGTFPASTFVSLQRSGGTFSITGVLDNTGHDLVVNATTGSLPLAGGTIRGGTVTLTPGFTILPTNSTANRLSAVTLFGAFAMSTNRYLSIGDGSVCAGAIAMTSGTLNLIDGWTNLGTIHLGGGTLRLGGVFTFAALGSFVRTGGNVHIIGTLDNRGQTLTLNNATGSWALIGGTILGGALVYADGQRLQYSTGVNRLEDVSVLSTFVVGEGSVYLSTATTFPSASLIADCTLGLDAGYVLGSEILSVLTGSGTRTVRCTQSGGVLTIGAGGVIRKASSGGSMIIRDCALINQGRLGHDSTGTFTVQPTELQNLGTISSLGGGAMNVSGLVGPTGNVLASGAGSKILLAGSGALAPPPVASNGGTLQLNGAWASGASASINGASFLELLGSYTTASIPAVSGTGGIVTILGTVINTASTLTVNAPGVTWGLESGGAIVGGDVQFVEPRALEARSSGRLAGVAVHGDLLVFGTLTIEGATTFQNVRIQGTLTAQSGTVIDSLVTWDGGAPVLRAEGESSTLTFGPNAVVRSGPAFRGTATITGSTGATIVNYGQILAGQTFVALRIDVPHLDNRGTIATTAGAVLRLQPAEFVNSGLVRISNATLILTLDLRSWPLGGTFERDGGTFQLSGSVDLAGGALTATEATGDIELNVISVHNTVLATSGSARFIVRDATIDGVQIAGRLDMYRITAASDVIMQIGSSVHLLPPLSGSPSSSIIFQASAHQISGVGEFVFDGVGTISASTSLSIGSGITVRTGSLAGTATISAPALTILGLISAQTPGGTLAIDGAWTNTGTIRALNGSALRLKGDFVTQSIQGIASAGGLVTLDGRLQNTGSTLRLDSTTGSWNLGIGFISGGAIELLDGTVLYAGSSNIINVAISGDIVVPANRTVGMTGVVTFNTVHLAGDNARLELKAGAALRGNVRAEGPGVSGRSVSFLNPGPGVESFILPSVSISTAAGFSAFVSVATTAGTPLVNQGEIRIESGGQSVLSGTPLRQQGTVHVSGSATLLVANVADYDPATGTLSHGAWSVGPGGTLRILQGQAEQPVRNIAASAAVRLDGAQAIFARLQFLQRIDGELTLSHGASLGALPATGVLTNTGVLTLASGGTLTVTGEYRQAPGGAIVFRAVGALQGQYGRLHATSSVHLDGDLSLVFDDGYQGALGNNLLLIDGSSIDGVFVNVVLPPTPPDQGFALWYEPTSVRYAAAHPSDWNGDGDLDSQDFFDFLEGFFNGDGDFNGADGTDSQDYFEFLEAFLSGR